MTHPRLKPLNPRRRLVLSARATSSARTRRSTPPSVCVQPRWTSSRSAALSERRRAAPSGDCDCLPVAELGEAELDSRREAELEWFNPTEWFNSEWLVDVASFSLRAASTIPGSATPDGDLGGLGDVAVRGLLVLNIVERWRVRGDLSDGDETFDVELKLW